nr:putative capsid protein [Picobirnavirus sp.]
MGKGRNHNNSSQNRGNRNSNSNKGGNSNHQNRNSNQQDRNAQNTDGITSSADGSNNSRRGKGSIMCNDPSWYLQNPSMASDMANFAWTTPQGSPMRMHNWVVESAHPLANIPKWHANPGILGLEVLPTFGLSIDADSSLNIAMHNIYTDVRYRNSGGKVYDAPDLFMYHLAIASLFSMMIWIQRTYAFTRLYTQKNDYMPHAYFAINHLDVTTFESNFATFHGKILLRLAKLQKFYVPTSMKLFDRMLFLFRDIYTEGTSLKDQQYMFVPAGFLKLGYDEDGATALKYVFIRDGEYLSMDAMFAIWDDMLAALNSESDIHTMSGDIERAFQGATFRLDPNFAIDYSVNPIFSIEVLEQIKNARCVGGDYYQEDIVQDESKGWIICRPLSRHTFPSTSGNARYAAGATTRALADNIILTTGTDAVGSALTMSNSRLSVMSYQHDILQNDDSGLVTQDYLITGTEIPYRFIVADYTVDTNRARLLVFDEYEYTMNLIDQSSGADVYKWLKRVADLSCFKYHPATLLFVTELNNSSYSYDVSGVAVNYDVDNFQIVTEEDLRNVHSVAIASLLGLWS